jgi:hypothetical protein
MSLAFLKELAIIKKRLSELAKNKDAAQEFIKKASIGDYIQKTMQAFDRKPEIEKKAYISAVVKEVIVHEDNSIELRLNPNPWNPDGYRHGGGQNVVLDKKWRERRDSNPRPSA